MQRQTFGEGVIVMLGNAPVSGSHTTQHCVILSTSKTEHVAIAHRANTASAIKAMLGYIQPHLRGSSINMYVDTSGKRR